MVALAPSPNGVPVGCIVLMLVAAGAALSYTASTVCMGSCFSTKGLIDNSKCESDTATCGGNTWEKLTCHNPTTCLDSGLTCRNWDVCSCCSAEPLYKCLLPTAAKAFASDCASPIDARQQCCGDAATHERTTDIEEAIKASVGNATTFLQTDAVDNVVDGVRTGIAKTREFVVRGFRASNL